MIDINFIKNNWSGKDFIKIGCNKNLRLLIEEQTKFLDNVYDNITLKQRAFFIINNLTENEIPKCACGCGKLVKVNKLAEKGFRKYYSENCNKKSYKINLESLDKLKNKDWLYNERILLKKSIETIASEINVSHVTVSKWLKKHEINNLIDARKRNQIANNILSDKNNLNQLYSQGFTCEEIANQLSTSKATVSRWLIHHNIERRNTNYYDRKINNVSEEEKSIVEFINTFYQDEIKTSNRSILRGKELDIYLPLKNLAIEYNGLYSHYYKPWENNESLIKGPKYHLNKTLECEKNGIQLLHIFSDEWNFKKEIVKSIIKSKLGINEKIYARKCTIIDVNTLDKNNFLNSNHIQGEDKSRVKIGLEYDRELVCLMTFNKSRFNKNYEWELVRFCNKLDINVIGGFSRLLNFFRLSFKGSIISYADRRWSNGNVYFKNGFELIRVNKPSYYYVDKNYLTRHNRMKFQKKLLGAYDCTEYEKARELGFNKIYDCGSLSFGLN